METPSSITKAPRFIYLDALRGIAAIFVVLFHLPRAHLLEPVLMHAIPRSVMTVVNLGDVGVQIFFVLSGFVIAYSLRWFDGTLRSFGLFLARRQLRLAPPYWAALLFVAGLAVIHHVIPALHATESISVSEFLVNMLYLHRIVHMPEVLTVSWTLCIEVQFYLIFTVLLLIPRLGFDLVQCVTILLGIAAVFLCPTNRIAAWFFEEWHLFALGVISYWVTTRRTSLGVFLLYSVAVICIAEHFGNWKSIVGCGVAFSIVAVAGGGKLGSALNWKWLQFIGMISYSLYLIHFPIELTVFKLGYKLTHENPAAALAYCVVSVVVSVLAAWAFFECVERPSMRAASNWKRSSKPANLSSTKEESQPARLAANLSAVPETAVI